jgi:hypothetical protein
MHSGAAIGRANLDGTRPDANFIRKVTSPYGVAVDSGFVYWAVNCSCGAIARANLDGTGANESFITGTTFPKGVAVDAG